MEQVGRLQAGGFDMLDVHYEDFPRAPENHLRHIADLCGLQATRERMTAATEGLNQERAYSFQSDPDARLFALEHRKLLERYGYPSANPAARVVANSPMYGAGD